MIQKDENILQEMLYKKTNAVIYCVQQWQQNKMDSDTCIETIREQYAFDIQFLELLNQKNNENKENKKLQEIY